MATRGLMVTVVMCGAPGTSWGFVPSLPATGSNGQRTVREMSSVTEYEQNQWTRFAEVMPGAWRGTWSTYDEEGVKQRETEAGVDVELSEDGPPTASHSILVNGRVMPVGQGYAPGNIGKHVLAGPACCVGPALLRSGLMSTEIVLRHESARVRVTVQHAPALNAVTEDAPPALKIYTVTVARETRQGDHVDPSDFWFPIDPFAWRRAWNGTTSLATPSSGPASLEAGFDPEETHWHNVRTADADYTLAQGNLLLQAPTLLPAGAGLKPIRLAWMPTPDKLLRAEAMILALDPDDDDVDLSTFNPPRLLALQADALSAPPRENTATDDDADFLPPGL